MAIHLNPTATDRATPFALAEYAQGHCHAREAGRARNLTAQASALHRANRDASRLWAEASKAWAEIGLTDVAEACAALANKETIAAEAVAA